MNIGKGAEEERGREREKWRKEEGKGVREKGARRTEALENSLVDYSKGYVGKVGMCLPSSRFLVSMNISSWMASRFVE